jgi:hypothetical protein
MKKMLLALSLVATGLSAQTLTSVTLEPAQPVTGQAVTATINLDASDMVNCGVRFYWGDGATTDVKVTDKAAIPYKLTHTYEKAGEYRTMAEGKKVTSHLKCGGQNVVSMLKVAAPAVAAAPAAQATGAPAGPTCPEGWRLDARSVNKKSGAYTCGGAKAGAAMPVARAHCPGKTTYFEDGKKRQFGCRS